MSTQSTQTTAFLLSLIGGIIIVLGSVISLFWSFSGSSYYGGMMGPWMMWGLGMGGIFMIIFWGLIILGVIFLIRWLAGMTKTTKSEESALDILKKRYARGEINKEEYEQKKRDLL